MFKWLYNLFEFVIQFPFYNLDNIGGIPQELPLRHSDFPGKSPNLIPLFCFPGTADMGTDILDHPSAFIMYFGIRYFDKSTPTVIRSARAFVCHIIPSGVCSTSNIIENALPLKIVLINDGAFFKSILFKLNLAEAI